MDDTTDRNEELEIALEQWAPFLIMDRARPGDVLLLRGAGLLSTGIALATAGHYSHAMLLLPAGWSDLWVAVEADGLGVGMTPLMPITLQDPTRRNAIFAASIPKRPVAWQLYRHPDIESVSAEALLTAANRLKSREFYLSYSKLHRLVAPVAVGERLKVIVGTLVDFTERAMTPDKSNGSFCSELVALFYEELGIGLFNEHRPAELVAPNDLAEGRSRLVPVDNAFVVLADVANWKGTKQFREIPGGRSQVLPYLVNRTRFAHKIRDKVTDVIDMAENAQESALNQSKLQASQILEQMKASERQYFSFGDSSRASAIHQLAATVELAVCLQQIANSEYLAVRAQCDAERKVERDSEVDHGDEFDNTREHVRIAREGAWATALGQIMIIATTLSGESLHKYLRISTLFAIRVNAITSRASKAPLAHLRARRIRSRLIRDWKEMRTQRQQVRKSNQDALSLLTSTEASELAVQLVVDAGIREIAPLFQEAGNYADCEPRPL